MAATAMNVVATRRPGWDYSRFVAIGNYCAIQDAVKTQPTSYLPAAGWNNPNEEVDGLAVMLSGGYSVANIERNQDALIVFS
jgi:hypothetical protein